MIPPVREKSKDGTQLYNQKSQSVTDQDQDHQKSTLYDVGNQKTYNFGGGSKQTCIGDQTSQPNQRLSNQFNNPDGDYEFFIDKKIKEAVSNEIAEMMPQVISFVLEQV